MRRLHLAEEPFCRRCLSAGLYVLGQVVDHIKAIRDGGDAFDDCNFQTLCERCHNTKRQQERGNIRTPCFSEGIRLPINIKPSVIPLTIVCGAPGSGKSTYISENACPDDLLIDLDVITAGLSGQQLYQGSGGWLAHALEVRNHQLRSLSSDVVHRAAWFAICAPIREEREHWKNMLGAELVVMDTPLSVCIERIKADRRRDGSAERMIQAATTWWMIETQNNRKDLDRVKVLI